MIKGLISSTSLRINVISNFVGNGATAIISFIFIPFFLKYLGAEAYGLIGIFTSFQVVLFLLDSGLSTTLNRELARLNVLKESAAQMKNLVKTLGTIYWFLAAGIGLVAVAFIPILATKWVKPNELSVDTIQYAFLLLSISLVFQFPIGFYSGGLLGLQRHLFLNVLKLFFSILKNVGALLVLIFYSKTVIAFFQWSLLVSILQVLAFKLSVWHFLPKSDDRAIFDKLELKRIWRFAVGITGISITAALFSQVDKIILSKTLPLSEFGYYSIASTLGLMIYQIIGPVTQSYFPKFAGLTNADEEIKLKSVFHQSCQLLSLLVIPATCMLAFFSKELVWIWTQNLTTVNNTWLTVAIFACGTGINGLLNIPYQLTLANGWTKLGLYQNLALLVLMVPLTIGLSTEYGVVGGATSWLIVNCLYFFIMPFLIHRRLLKGELGYWYWNDIAKPFFMSVLAVFCFKYFIYNPPLLGNRWLALGYLFFAGITTVMATFLFVKDLRPILKTIYAK